jgi:hypothetical protein
MELDKAEMRKNVPHHAEQQLIPDVHEIEPAIGYPTDVSKRCKNAQQALEHRNKHFTGSVDSSTSRLQLQETPPVETSTATTLTVNEMVLMVVALQFRKSILSPHHVAKSSLEDDRLQALERP